MNGLAVNNLMTLIVFDDIAQVFLKQQRKQTEIIFHFIFTFKVENNNNKHQIPNVLHDLISPTKHGTINFPSLFNLFSM